MDALFKAISLKMLIDNSGFVLMSMSGVLIGIYYWRQRQKTGTAYFPSNPMEWVASIVVLGLFIVGAALEFWPE